jgi:hypothetical protein
VHSDLSSRARYYPGPSGIVVWAELTDVIRLEVRLLQDLLAIIQRQRKAVLADDLQVVEETIYDTHRVLHTLGEAKRRRKPINQRLGLDGDVSVREFDSTLRAQMPAELHRVTKELEQLASTLAAEIETNREVLRKALIG